VARRGPSNIALEPTPNSGNDGGAEAIATGRGIENLNRLNKVYGKKYWRKLKGICQVELEDGTILDVEVRWYEKSMASGKKNLKSKNIYEEKAI
jgi:hypothetical protein